jgi:OmpA-OmpF porin, OOP family
LRRLILVCAAALFVTACGRSDDRQENSAGAQAENGADTTGTETPSPANEAAPSEGQSAGFDISTVPVSTSPLGQFPFFSLPAGYKESGREKTLDFGHFPFWTGTGLNDVEGKVYMSRISTERDKTFSLYELKRNLDAVIRQAGGVQVVEGKIPKDVRDELPDEVRVGMVTGLGDIYNNPVTVWAIRRPDREIWVHFTGNSASAAWTIVESQPFEQTAALLPAAQLQDAIDKDGNATIHVNFATDKADILPDSQPQIDQIVTVLRNLPTLRLSINGYTDNSGAAAHNLALSDARAKSVVAALVDKGVAASRLQAKGFGDRNPVADNHTEDGRARNRRVELVRL